MGKNRLISHKVNRLLDMFPVVAVIGPRQCGKSTLVQQLYPDWKYYDLESPDDYQLITERIKFTRYRKRYNGKPGRQNRNNRDGTF